MLIFWVTWPHTGRIVTQWRFCKESKDRRGQTYLQPLLLRSEMSLFWRTSCCGQRFLNNRTFTNRNTQFFWKLPTPNQLISKFRFPNQSRNSPPIPLTLIFQLARVFAIPRFIFLPANFIIETGRELGGNAFFSFRLIFIFVYTSFGGPSPLSPLARPPPFSYLSARKVFS